jgi:hypothetical protein
MPPLRLAPPSPPFIGRLSTSSMSNKAGSSSIFSLLLPKLLAIDTERSCSLPGGIGMLPEALVEGAPFAFSLPNWTRLRPWDSMLIVRGPEGENSEEMGRPLAGEGFEGERDESRDERSGEPTWPKELTGEMTSAESPKFLSRCCCCLAKREPKRLGDAPRGELILGLVASPGVPRPDKPAR